MQLATVLRVLQEMLAFRPVVGKMYEDWSCFRGQDRLTWTAADEKSAIASATNSRRAPSPIDIFLREHFEVAAAPPAPDAPRVDYAPSSGAGSAAAATKAATADAAASTAALT